MRFFTFTEAGAHQSNEDEIAVRTHPANREILISVLCDGQGGNAGGASASESAVESCLEIAANTEFLELSDPFAWIEIGRKIDQKVEQTERAGFTTLIGLAIGNDFVAGAPCGDSRALLLLDDKSFDLTAAQIKYPALGSGAADLRPFSAKLEGKWKILLMSDGVWKFIDARAVEDCLREYRGQELVQSLKKQVILAFRELPDDFSIILIEP